MTCRLVFGDESVSDGSINNGNRLLVRAGRSVVITAVYGCKSFLDCGSERRTLAGFMATTSFILSCPLSGLC